MRGLTNSWAPISGLREAIASQPRDLLLLRRELRARLGGRARSFAPAATNSPRARSANASIPIVGEHLLGCPQPLARLAEPAPAAQPLAEEQMCAGQLGPRRVRLSRLIASR